MSGDQCQQFDDIMKEQFLLQNITEVLDSCI